jgi:uncharacterized glyoxalase superfamily protein PhnB
MHAHANGPSRTIVPTLRYRDVAAAIDWLCNAFGFERHQVVPGEGGGVCYAELTFGDGMIMLAPVEDCAFDGLMTQPADTGGAETQICYLFVEDAAAHCTQAKAAGAEIVLDIEEGGGRGYSCRDPEGHIWNFGTYDPWKRQAAEAGKEDEVDRRSGSLGRRLKTAALVSGALVALAASAVVADWATGASGWIQWETQTQAAAGSTDASARAARGELTRALEGREAAEQAVKVAREQLVQERAAREAAERIAREAERAARETREQLAKAAGDQAGKEAREMRERLGLAERTVAALRNELAAERTAREAADRATHQIREQLERETSAKDEAERNKQTREKASKERAAKEAAERAAKEAAAKEVTERAAKEAAERASKDAAERAAKEARERKERAAAARRPAPRRTYSEPQSKSPPVINWFSG